MAKSKRKDKAESAPQGTARITLSKANFFLDQANRSERNIKAYECYVEAAVIFGPMVLNHLKKEFGRKRGFEKWIELRERSTLIKVLIDTRDNLIHVRPMSIISSQEDSFYYGDQSSPDVQKAHKLLRNQLDEVKAIIDECERRFK